MSHKVGAVSLDAADELTQLSEKVTPDTTDILLIEDSAAGNIKKKVQLGNLPGGSGGTGTTVAVDWSHMTMTVDQLTPLVGDLILFDNEKAGSGMTHNSAGLITLKAGKTYKIDLALGVSWSSSLGTLGADIYDYTNGAILISRVYTVPPTNGANIRRGSGDTSGVITVGGSDIQIGARITIASSITKIYNELSGTRLIIIEVGASNIVGVGLLQENFITLSLPGDGTLPANGDFDLTLTTGHDAVIVQMAVRGVAFGSVFNPAFTLEWFKTAADRVASAGGPGGILLYGNLYGNAILDGGGAWLRGPGGDDGMGGETFYTAPVRDDDLTNTIHFRIFNKMFASTPADDFTAEIRILYYESPIDLT